jgi:hypothetical protein
MTVVCPKHCLGHVLGMHTHLVVAATEVKLREENNVVQLVQELFYYRNGELVVGGVTRKIRMTTLTRERVQNTFKHKVRAQRDCDSLCKKHKFQKV